MMKRLLSLVLALVMLCTMLPQVLVTVEAKEGFGPTIEGLSGQRDFRWPVPGYYGLSSCFYDNRIASGESKEHYAIDIATGGVKANIVASYDGIVCEITYNGSSDGGYGNAVMVKHNYVMATGETMTLYSRYAHMDSIKVSTGQKVIAGQTVVGTVGGSGYGGTPYPIHLDFQILTSTAWRQRETCSIDPYANNLLELPNGIYKGGTTDCCQRYIDLAKNLYSTPISYIGRCTSYPAYCAIEVSSSTTYIKSLPCSEKTDASSTNVEIASKGEQYQAIGLVENTAGNLWYKVKAKNGTTGYMYAGDTTYIAQTISDIEGSGITAPTTHKAGAIYALTGTVSATYNQLTAVSAYVYAGNSEQGSRETGASASVSGNSYSLGGSAIDNQTEFNKLPVGTHTYVVWASYKNYYAKSATSVGTNTGETGVYKATFSVVSGSSSHTCDKGTYMYFEAVHPHRSCYKCSVCGTIWAVDGTSNYYDACTECTSSKMPGKPVLQFSSNGTDAAPVTFTWASTVNTTHYNMWIRKKNSSGEWESYEHLTYISSGVTRTLPTGEYRFELQSYNSNAWMDDGTDWAHALGDYVYLTINCYCSYTDIVTQEATCTQPGVLTYICSKCGASYTETIAATGNHSYVGKVTTEAYCGGTGTKTYTCSGCGACYTETIPATGAHSWGAWTTTEAATCEWEGTQSRTCYICGSEETRTIPATGHDYSQWQTLLKPTCTSVGYKQRICNITMCGRIEMEEIAATGHNYVSLTVEPRCETQGCTQHGCTYCYDYYEDAFVPALGHNYQNGSCTRCGKTEPGSLDDSLVGDLDGVPGVAVDDAVYLLQHVLMPELFPVSQPADIDGNGQVNVDDAVYLLQHILMPELFPLYDKGTVLLPHSCLTFYRYLKGQGDGPLVSRDGITKKEHLPGCSFFVIALCLQLRFVRRRSA